METSILSPKIVDKHKANGCLRQQRVTRGDDSQLV